MRVGPLAKKKKNTPGDMTVIAAGKHAPGIGWHQVGMSDCLLLVTRLFYTPGG